MGGCWRERGEKREREERESAIMEDDGGMVQECGGRYTTGDKSTLQITLESRSFLSSKLIY